MNLLTFDIEEWVLYKGARTVLIKECDQYLEQILDKLDERQIKATFFCVGAMAEAFPHVVRLIQGRGHEIGCHSATHTWLNKMTEQECREDTHRAVSNLEQCIGKKVLSYRAPAFSIGRNNVWAFDILAENGITCDASVFPAARDFGGFPNFGVQKPCIIRHNGICLKEFPVPMTTVFGKRLAYSGGGYFRFFPLWYVKKEIAQSDYVMCYFHLGDLLPESNGVMSREAYEAYFKEPGTLKARYMRYLKSNLGKKGALAKMMKLIESEDFVNVAQSCERLDWTNVPIVKL